MIGGLHKLPRLLAVLIEHHSQPVLDQLHAAYGGEAV